MSKFDPLRFIADHAGMALADAISEAYRQGQQDVQHVPNTNDGDTISRQAAIAVADYTDYPGLAIEDVKKVTDEVVKGLKQLPPAQPESYKEKLKEIADALSEKFAYMNTCLNERDIILGYLGVKRPSKTHCNTDCTNTKCESHPLSSAQPEIVRCKECRHWQERGLCDKWDYYIGNDDFYCGCAERREE